MIRSKLIRPNLAALVAVPLSLVCAFASASVLAYEARELTSPGGIDFRHAEMPDQESVSIQVAWPSDWAYTERSSATPYVGAELLLAGGAGEMGPAEMQQAFEELQAEGGLNVVADHAHGYLNVRARDLDAAIELAAIALAEPAFDERWFERIRGGFAANVVDAKLQSGARVGDVLRRAALGESDLERFLSLTPPEIVTEVTLEDIRRWHAKTLVRAGMTVAVAGGIDAEAAGKAVDALLGALPAGEGASAVPDVELDFSPRTVLLEDPDAGKSVVSLLGRLPPTSAGGELEDILATLALGGGGESRLHEALRTELRAAYDVQVLLDSQTRALRGLLIYAEVDTDKLADARRAVREEYARFLADGPTDEEIDAAKTQLAEGLRQMLATPAATARSLVEATLDGQPPERVVDLPAELDAITTAAVRERLGDAYPAGEEMIEVVLTPDVETLDAESIGNVCAVTSIDEVESCGQP